MIVGIVATASFFTMIEAPPLFKAKKKKELWLFSILLLIGTGLCISVSLDIVIPNPLDLVYVVFKPMSRLLDNLLK